MYVSHDKDDPNAAPNESRNAQQPLTYTISSHLLPIFFLNLYDPFNIFNFYINILTSFAYLITFIHKFSLYLYSLSLLFCNSNTMQQAIPYKSWQSHLSLPSLNHNHPTVGKGTGKMKMINDMVTENPVMVIVRKGCCMGHVVKHLLLGHGVNPNVYEVDEKDEDGLIKELELINGGDEKTLISNLQFPAVFIGGRLFGGLDRVMAAHITGDLVPLLKQAGALWL